MKALIKHIVRKTVDSIIHRVLNEHSEDDIAERAAEKIGEQTRRDRHFMRELASEIDLDNVAEKVVTDFEPDYGELADNVSVEALAAEMQDRVVDEVMSKLPTPLQALIEMPTEPKIDLDGKPELVNRLIDRAAEMLLNIAADMADKEELDE